LGTILTPVSANQQVLLCFTCKCSPKASKIKQLLKGNLGQKILGQITISLR
jgi:hypothetical protein